MIKILETPAVYIAFQRLVGGAKMREVCLDLLALQAGERVLDIGCGPAYYFDRLPKVDYFGFDTASEYIAYARRNFGDRGKFFDEPYTEAHAQELAPFDAVMLMGLLHHLSDQEASSLLGLVARSLQPSGRAIALDTTVHPGQSWFERKLSLGDRGEYVRSPEAFVALAEPHFGVVDAKFPPPSWVPDCHWIMELRSPRSNG